MSKQKLAHDFNMQSKEYDDEKFKKNNCLLKVDFKVLANMESNLSKSKK